MSMPTAASLLNMYHCTPQLIYVNQLALMFHSSLLHKRQFDIAQLGSKDGVPRRIRDVSFGKLSFNKKPETGIQGCSSCVFPRSVAGASMALHTNFSTIDTLNKYETIMSSFQGFVLGIGNASSLPFLLAILVFLTSSIYLAERLSKSQSFCISTVDKGLLILSPTAFNRSVIARCSSIIFETSGDADGDAFNKVGLQCHQIVSISNAFGVGKNKASISNEDGAKLTYQRLCIDAEDGGVLALDWPSHLDIRGEHGLDTTLLLIPGCAKGSKDPVILEFVEVALQSGYFPIVMNPRGCAGSPVTTPRLFSGQDSNDVRTAVSFLARARPWAVIMGVGWDFGANCLTKYLGEEKDATPLAAVVCINNPFDLDACTKLLKYFNGGTLDRELTKGLTEILRTNEALFQGRKNKNCNIFKGLTASSMRDFDFFVSAPTHGYESLQEFYASASCGNLIQDVKVPLLCIQDHTMCPISTVPQHVFEGSPYTTLVFSPFGRREAYGKQSQKYGEKMMQDTFNHQLTLEWLTAVELAFLKGRSPTLDTESKLSKSWDSLRTGVQSVEIVEQLLDSIPCDSQPINEVSFAEISELEPEELKSKEENKKDEQTAVEDMQKGEACHAAESILNVLEVIMPGSFSIPMKQQVLGAVESGETVVNALESAVPADVRDKLLTAVSGAAQARGINFDIVGFNSSIPPPRLPPGMLESIQEKLSVITGKGRQNDFSATIFNIEKGKTNTPAANSDAHKKASKVAANDHDKQDARSEPDNGNAELAPDTDNSEAESRAENPDLVNSEFQVEGAFRSDHSGTDKETYSAEETNLSMLGQTAESDTKTEVESLVARRETKKTTDIAKIESPTPKFPAPIDVGQAIEALTGIDDSTQMAVTSIFGVIEGMLEKIENESQRRDGKNGDEHSSERSSFDDARSLKAKEAIILSTDHSDTQHNQASSPNDNQQRPDVDEINEKLKATCLRGFILDLQGKVYINNNSKRVAASRSGVPCTKYMMYQDAAAKNESFENLYLVSIMEPEETCKLLSVFCQGNKDKKIAKMYKGLSSVELASTGLLELPIEDGIAAAVHKLVLKAVEMELERRLQSELLKDFRHALNEDLLKVANSVAKAAWKSMLVPQVVQVSAKSRSQGPICRQILGAEAIAQAVASVYSHTVVLQQVLPFGILVGVILVALATSFQAVIANQSVGKFRPDAECPALRESRSKENEDDNNDHFSKENRRSSVTGSINKGGALQGAVASAMSASAVYAEHKTSENCPSDSFSSTQHRMDIDGAEEIVRENQSMMTNIERAISVASPVVPTKDGEVDHEKLVAVLAGLGQKFGFLRFVGKAALLWGGLRGAMSLTEKLILFLRISERPLLQRILGFAAMVMLLWAPVIVPLLPTLLNQYASHSPASIASFASVVGLHGAIIILVIIWGKTIRGYEEPLLGYGLNLFSSEKVKDLFIGLITGFGLVGALYGLFMHFHFIDLRMTAVISISNSTLSILILHWKLLKLSVQALAVGISIAMVEEVLFRSWLIEEMTVDLGYWKAVFLSGFVFAILHRSLSAIPGLWLLSIALSIARARFNGELAFPVGLHAGLITANFVLTVGGFVEYHPNVSNWLTGGQAGNPLAGLVGILMMGILIFTLYPWKFFHTFQRGNRNEGENIIR